MTTPAIPEVKLLAGVGMPGEFTDMRFQLLRRYQRWCDRDRQKREEEPDRFRPHFAHRLHL
jgi:hypothetical protein